MLIVVFFLMVNWTEAQIYPKCCDSESVLIKSNSSTTYICNPTDDKSLQILTNKTGFLNVNSSGSCMDVYKGELILLDIQNDGIVVHGKRIYDWDYFPKCCPINYFYDSKTHSCTFSYSQIATLPIAESIVKVGLTNCKIIVDFAFKSPYNFERLNTKSLYLPTQNNWISTENYCLDFDEFANNYIARVCNSDYKICDTTKCMHKCCPDGQSFVNGSKCKFTYTYGLDLNFSKKIHERDAPFAIIHGHELPVYILKESKSFHLDAKGVFVMYESLQGINSTNRYPVDEYTYCIEHVTKKTEKINMNGFTIFRMFPQQSIYIKFLFTRYAMAISCVFLCLTILYYGLTKETKNLFGKTLISYCLASLAAFMVLSYLAFNQVTDESCQIFGVIVVYSTLASFTWMNIMCIDIYCTFGSSKSFACAQQKSREIRRFLWFSLYGWIFPLLLTALSIFFLKMNILPSSVIRFYKCRSNRGSPSYADNLFVIIPLGLLEICNLVLFIKTVIHCLRVRGEISRMNDTQTIKAEKTYKLKKYRDRISLLFKLFVIMGISFLFEVISGLYDFKQNSVTAVIEIVWDTFNSLQGLFIFLIFICKKRNWTNMCKKVGFKNMRRSSQSSATTQSIVKQQSSY